MVHPIPSVFLIYGFGASVDDTITVNLNHFQDENGTVLSGILEIKYDGAEWVPRVVE
ncbi:hypothetical protein ACQCVH_06670 [Bacillus infantis]|uniref:hypothetical protein n=1 Tax=Bacillus infantis TaxID=324767 RepID=UPI003CFAE2D9